MVKVKLLKDVAEGGKDLKLMQAAAAALGITEKHHMYPCVKTTRSHGVVVKFVKGAVVTMHEASAAKWIAAGLCEVTKEKAAFEPAVESEAK